MACGSNEVVTSRRRDEVSSSGWGHPDSKRSCVPFGDKEPRCFLNKTVSSRTKYNRYIPFRLIPCQQEGRFDMKGNMNFGLIRGAKAEEEMLITHHLQRSTCQHFNGTPQVK